MKLYIGQPVKIIANESAHRFKIGEIVKLRSVEEGRISAWCNNYTTEAHGRGGWWWINKKDFVPIFGAKVV